MLCCVVYVAVGRATHKSGVVSRTRQMQGDHPGPGVFLVV